MQSVSLESRVAQLEARLEELAKSDAEKTARLARINRSHTSIAKQASDLSREIEEKLSTISRLERALGEAEQTAIEQASALQCCVAANEQLSAQLSEHARSAAAAQAKEQKRVEDWVTKQLKQRDVELARTLSVAERVSAQSASQSDLDGLRASVEQAEQRVAALAAAVAATEQACITRIDLALHRASEQAGAGAAPSDRVPRVGQLTPTAGKPHAKQHPLVVAKGAAGKSGTAGKKGAAPKAVIRSKSFTKGSAGQPQRTKLSAAARDPLAVPSGSDPLLADVLRLLFPDGVPVKGLSVQRAEASHPPLQASGPKPASPVALEAAVPASEQTGDGDGSGTGSTVL